MEITRYVMGPVETNTYLLQIGDDVLLVDPASKAEKLLEIIGERNLCGILLTHGHFDHIKAVDGLYEHYHCPVYLHEDDEELARDKYSGKGFGLVSYLSCPTIGLKEGKMEVGPFSFEVMFTPGHTDGSVVFIFDDCIFTGDTLFKGSVGRTDLKSGDFSKLKHSLQLFKQLDRDYVIYPGHEDMTTLSHELMTNYFLN